MSYLSCIESESRLDARILYYGKNNTQLDITTIQEHAAANTGSLLVAKSVLDGKAMLTSEHFIKVSPSAFKTQAEQVHKSIILSEEAQVRTQPTLEIENNDVVCKHGAAISCINQEQISYLSSRGLSTEQAQKIIIEGFLR